MGGTITRVLCLKQQSTAIKIEKPHNFPGIRHMMQYFHNFPSDPTARFSSSFELLLQMFYMPNYAKVQFTIHIQIFSPSSTKYTRTLIPQCSPSQSHRFGIFEFWNLPVKVPIMTCHAVFYFLLYLSIYLSCYCVEFSLAFSFMLICMGRKVNDVARS